MTYNYKNGIKLKLAVERYSDYQELEKSGNGNITFWGNIPNIGNISLFKGFIADREFNDLYGNDGGYIIIIFVNAIIGKHLNYNDPYINKFTFISNKINSFFPLSLIRKKNLLIYKKAPINIKFIKRKNSDEKTNVEIEIDNVTFSEGLKFNNVILQLYSLFLWEKCDVLYANIEYKNGGLIEKLPILINQLSNQDLIFELADKNSYPITYDGIKDKFQFIFSEWTNLYFSKFSLPNKLIIEHIYNNKVGYDVYILLISALAQWQRRHGKIIDKKKSYDAFISENFNEDDRYFMPKIKEILPFAQYSNFGKILGNIRDCIVHSNQIDENKGIDKQIISFIEEEYNIYSLCEVIYMLLIKVIYKKLGITLNNRTQSLLTLKIKRYHSILL